MTLHESTFGYLNPHPDEVAVMQRLRDAAKAYADVITASLPESADRTYALRTIRTVAMWCNVAVTRNPDGSPRSESPPEPEPPAEPHEAPSTVRYDSTPRRSSTTATSSGFRHA